MNRYNSNLLFFMSVLVSYFIFSCGDTPEENYLDVCQDSVDNDGDSYTDCRDQDCWIFDVCLNQRPSPDADTDADTDRTSGIDIDTDTPDENDTAADDDSDREAATEVEQDTEAEEHQPIAGDDTANSNSGCDCSHTPGGEHPSSLRALFFCTLAM